MKCIKKYGARGHRTFFNSNIFPKDFESKDEVIEYLDNGELLVRYNDVKSVTPGQACVFYVGEKCVGGGIIITYDSDSSSYTSSNTKRGKLNITGGTIRSGSMIVAKNIGSTMGTTTNLEVGMEPEIIDEKHFLASKIYVDYLWTLWAKMRVPYDGQPMEDWAQERYARLKGFIEDYKNIK